MPTFAWAIYGFITGLCFGSFTNVIVYRIPKGFSVYKKPSECPACGEKLKPYDLIPLFSWLLLQGRCRFCKAPVSLRYPVVEFTCGLLFAGMVFFTPSLSAIPLSFFAFVLLAVSLVDAEIREIPDGLVLAGTVAGTAWIGASFIVPDVSPGSELLPFVPGWQNALIGAAVGAVPLLVIDRICLWLLKKDGFGYGDMKLMAMIGIFLGWELVLVTFLFAFVSAGIFAAGLMIAGRAERGSYMAFGPFLCFAGLVSLWFGRDFITLMFP